MKRQIDKVPWRVGLCSFTSWPDKLKKEYWYVAISGTQTMGGMTVFESVNNPDGSGCLRFPSKESTEQYAKDYCKRHRR
jgi:hypothetical protein